MVALPVRGVSISTARWHERRCGRHRRHGCAAAVEHPFAFLARVVVVPFPLFVCFSLAIIQMWAGPVAHYLVHHACISIV